MLNLVIWREVRRFLCVFPHTCTIQVIWDIKTQELYESISRCELTFSAVAQCSNYDAMGNSTLYWTLSVETLPIAWIELCACGRVVSVLNFNPVNPGLITGLNTHTGSDSRIIGGPIYWEAVLSWLVLVIWWKVTFIWRMNRFFVDSSLQIITWFRRAERCLSMVLTLHLR